MSEVFLDVKEIQKSFDGVHALKGVNLTIRKGEVHCLAGENGCGKSTLIKIISGAQSADSGTITIDGEAFTQLKPIEAIRKGIQVIYQDFSVFPNLSVAENIALNNELSQGRKIVNWKRIQTIAATAMDLIGVQLDPHALIETQSVANKQLVAICRALLNDAKLIIMDEPTTALTHKEVQRLMEIIHSLKDKGIAILFVNHKIDEVYDIADSLTIFRNGEFVASGPISEFDRARFVYCMTGRTIEDKQFVPDQIGEDVFDVKNLRLPGVLEEINISIKKGEIIGIAGLLGSGRTELGNALFGLMPGTTGEFILNGQPVDLSTPQKALAAGIGYVPEDRLTEGLFLSQSIGLNALAAILPRFARKGRLALQAMDIDMHRWVKELHIAAPSPYPAVKTLSGGNQQKVVISKWLSSQPKVLILNGPTVGVDIGAKSDIHQILRDLAKKGVGILFISDDVQELMLNCNRILIMREGRIVAETSASDCTESHLTQILCE